jgi:2-polyprenyl-3-methyl-5-hydroxy-6-metoxy-1,4-benzoquinol methylase
VLTAEWRAAQEWEREWWAAAWTPARAAIERVWTDQVFRFLGLTPESFGPSPRIVDVGAGPTVRALWFADAKVTAIEPLADAYAALPCCALAQCVKVYAQPGEKPVPELAGCADAVTCINALDHAQDARQFIAALASYLRPGGALLLSVDLHRVCPGHPLALTAEEVDAALAAEGLAVESRKAGMPPAFGRSCWGSGVAVSWICRRPAP